MDNLSWGVDGFRVTDVAERAHVQEEGGEEGREQEEDEE